MAIDPTRPSEPQGNIVLNFNPRARTNSRAPHITGRISTPDAPELFYPFTLFRHIDKADQPYFIGPVDTVRSMRQALQTTAQSGFGMHFLAMRFNTYKTFAELENGEPNPDYLKLSADDRALEDAKPFMWGSWTRRPDRDQLLRAHAWDRGMGRFGPWGSGTVQIPRTKEEIEALRRGDAEALAESLSRSDPDGAHAAGMQQEAGDDPQFGGR